MSRTESKSKAKLELSQGKLFEDDDGDVESRMNNRKASISFASSIDRAVASKDNAFDLTGLRGSSLAYWLIRYQEKLKAPLLLVAGDQDKARALAKDLSAMLRDSSLEPAKVDSTATADNKTDDGEEKNEEGDQNKDVVFVPAQETSPYAEVMPDRRIAMDRVSALSRLAAGPEAKFVVVDVAAWIRKVPPKQSLSSKRLSVVAAGELDRDGLVQTLAEAGYLRVPVVEDAGTFAVRGSLLDIYPPDAQNPYRIELDDYLVLSIKEFDPDSQRSLGTVTGFNVSPVKDAVFGARELSQAKEKIREACEELDLPTRATKALLEEIDSGRAMIGFDALLPAFYERLDPIESYLPKSHRLVLIDPTELDSSLQEERILASADREARLVRRAPSFPLDAFYASDNALAAELASRKHVVIHRTIQLGASEFDRDQNQSEAEDHTHQDGPNVLGKLGQVDPDAVLDLGAQDNKFLIAELEQRRVTQGKNGDVLTPLAQHAKTLMQAGYSLFFVARTRTQAERLSSLLRNHDLKPEQTGAVLNRSLFADRSKRNRVCVGELSAGFMLESEALAVITEEEIFGSRTKREKRKKKSRATADAFLEDLRALEIGDYIVHEDHGIGRYLGLEKKALGFSRSEEMAGLKPPVVEVLVIEYAAGDKLYFPVTRLHKIQKFSNKEGNAPKLDRLGGASFQKTKAKVRKQVQEMADELLKLYAERAATKRIPLPATDDGYAEFEATFPYEETPDQMRAIEDVLSDFEREFPMDRIVCGDVGFGKTEVAIRAAYRMVLAGKQVAVMCPTTVLAQQHYQTFLSRMKNNAVRIEQLSRFVDNKKQGEVLAALKEGAVDIVIGTHRLLSKDVHFRSLGLLVVDEEQRFGVAHKERVKKIRKEVDVLTLTATPIPRTLQLAVGGLRDLSLITTPPSDRRAVRTLVTRWDDQILRDAIRRELMRGGQAFFVYNRIEGLYERANRIKELVPEARIAVVHGQMSETSLEEAMTDFVAGKYDVLCATAIIESGLDIPRANTIMIDGANNFGLAQLYQLRGRVGRSKERAYCYLVTPPLNQLTDDARARIEALERFSELGSGFKVASLDMELRGAGDVLGAEQSGAVAQVGFDLFLHMLQEAMAELRGEPLVHDVDPELNFDTPLFLPEDYVDDVGLRLSFYKRFAQADSEQDVSDLAQEMEDRFGPPPAEASFFVRAMELKPALRALRVLGLEATQDRVTLHLREDTTLDPAKLLPKVQSKNGEYKLSPDMKLTRRFLRDAPASSLHRVEQFLSELELLKKASA